MFKYISGCSLAFRCDDLVAFFNDDYIVRGKLRQHEWELLKGDGSHFDSTRRTRASDDD